MQTLTIIQPDDMHLHLRDGEALKAVLPFTARQMGRAVIMPNLKPPVASVADALAYRARIEAALPEGSTFEPLMTLYLTDNTTPDTVREAKAAGIVAFKLYPAGATTNSDSGVTDLFKLIPVLQTMAQEGILFLVHGEVTDPEIDIFDREAVFIERVMKPVLEKVPTLKVVFEHITTADAARLVMEAGENVAASVTPQHLLLNRNDLLVGGVRPHHYCLPVLKRESHRKALVAAITRSPSFSRSSSSTRMTILPALMSAMISVIGASALMLCPLFRVLRRAGRAVHALACDGWRARAARRSRGSMCSSALVCGPVRAAVQACAASSFFHSSMRST